MTNLTPAELLAHTYQDARTRIHGVPQPGHLDMDALAEALAGWLTPDEAERLKALTATCCCGTSPMDYEGPQPDCPVHGAVRAFNEASARLAAVQPIIDAARAYRAHYTPFRDSPVQYVANLIAAVDDLDADSPPEGPTQ